MPIDKRTCKKKKKISEKITMKKEYSGSAARGV